jgi:hypothetical protein
LLGVILTVNGGTKVEDDNEEEDDSDNQNDTSTHTDDYDFFWR